MLNHDVEEGIQADDEDNDQIETERNSNPGMKRQAELQRILHQKGHGDENSRAKASGHQGATTHDALGRSCREPRGDVLF